MLGKRKYDNEVCDDEMTFEECELAILRSAVDESDKIQKKKIANSDDIKAIMKTLERFLRAEKTIIYGGLAINNILPEEDRFYDRRLDIPDYDFYSTEPLQLAKRLADIYYAEGKKDVEAKAGVHSGTFKVFVNFIPVADITYLHPELFEMIKKDAIVIDGLSYAPPDFLRMSMFLELSRPEGDVSRWEKVLTRITKLNKAFPIEHKVDCRRWPITRPLASLSDVHSQKLFELLKNEFVKENAVFFGGFGIGTFIEYMTDDQKRLVEKKNPDFDVLHEDPIGCAEKIKKLLDDNGFPNSEIVHHESLGEIIPFHVSIKIGDETFAMIFSPIACHNFNEIKVENQTLRIATIDTMLSFYLAFMYSGKPYLKKERMICLSTFLFDVEEKTRLKQIGVLKRFTLSCIGKQPTLETIRAEKAEKFKELAGAKNSEEYEYWFLRYTPGEEKKEKVPGETGMVRKTEKKSLGKRKRLSATQKRQKSPPSFFLNRERKKKRRFFFW